MTEYMKDHGTFQVSSLVVSRKVSTVIAIEDLFTKQYNRHILTEKSQVGPIVNIYSCLIKRGKVIKLTSNTSNGKVRKHLLTRIW